MFGKKKTCNCCGGKTQSMGLSVETQIADGILCPLCSRFCKRSTMVTVQQIKDLIARNHTRFLNFNPTIVLHDTGPHYFVYIDQEQQLCYYTQINTSKVEPIIFSFDEIESFHLEMIGQKTEIVRKGGIGRAVVGGAILGPTGAIVGAATASQEVKTTNGTPVIYVDLDFGGCKTTIEMFYPPKQTMNLLQEIAEKTK